MVVDVTDWVLVILSIAVMPWRIARIFIFRRSVGNQAGGRQTQIRGFFLHTINLSLAVMRRRTGRSLK